MSRRKLQMQEYNLESDFYVVPLGGVDVVLGIKWLQTLGTYFANHQEHFIEFHAFGKTHKLYGFQPPPTHQMEKLRWKDAPTYILQCREMEILTSEGYMDKQPEIQEIIQKHRKVFQELPIELLPNRKTEHIIEIDLGQNLLVTNHTDIHIRDITTIHVIIFVK